MVALRFTEPQSTPNGIIGLPHAEHLYCRVLPFLFCPDFLIHYVFTRIINPSPRDYYSYWNGRLPCQDILIMWKTWYSHWYSDAFHCSAFLCADSAVPSPKQIPLPFLTVLFHWWWGFSATDCLEKALFSSVFEDIFIFIHSTVCPRPYPSLKTLSAILTCMVSDDEPAVTLFIHLHVTCLFSGYL